MGRPPINDRAMTDAERQRRRRQKLRPPFDARKQASALTTKLEGRGYGAEEYRALIDAMIAELADEGFVTSAPVTKSRAPAPTLPVVSPPPKKRPDLRAMSRKEAREARKEIGRRWHLEKFAEAKRKPIEEVKRAKAKMAASHPDKGGTAEEHIKAREVWKAHETALKRRQREEAEAVAKRRKRSEAARRRKGGPKDIPVTVGVKRET